jgi:hypothetical protein
MPFPLFLVFYILCLVALPEASVILENHCENPAEHALSKKHGLEDDRTYFSNDLD